MLAGRLSSSSQYMATAHSSPCSVFVSVVVHGFGVQKPLLSRLVNAYSMCSNNKLVLDSRHNCPHGSYRNEWTDSGFHRLFNETTCTSRQRLIIWAGVCYLIKLEPRAATGITLRKPPRARSRSLDVHALIENGNVHSGRDDSHLDGLRGFFCCCNFHILKGL